MSKYEKPVVNFAAGSAEGVFMSSGDTTGGGSGNLLQCNSKYMKGTFKANDWSIPADSPNYTNYNVRGCEGCPANWGSMCALTDPGYNPSQATANSGKFMPYWEAAGQADTAAPQPS